MNEVTLRELIESEIRRAETNFDTRLTALENAVNKSEKLLSERLEGIPSQMATREQLRMTQERLEDRVAVSENKIRELEQQRAYIIGGAAALAALISVLGLVIR